MALSHFGYTSWSDDLWRNPAWSLTTLSFLVSTCRCMSSPSSSGHLSLCTSFYSSLLWYQFLQTEWTAFLKPGPSFYCTCSLNCNHHGDDHKYFLLGYEILEVKKYVIIYSWSLLKTIYLFFLESLVYREEETESGNWIRSGGSKTWTITCASLNTPLTCCLEWCDSM